MLLTIELTDFQYQLKYIWEIENQTNVERLHIFTQIIFFNPHTY